MKRIRTPDGYANFPDDMPDAEIERVLQREYQHEQAVDSEAQRQRDFRAPRGVPGTPLRALEDFNREGLGGIVSQAWRHLPWSDELAGLTARLPQPRAPGVTPDIAAEAATRRTREDREQYAQEHPGGNVAAGAMSVIGQVGAPAGAAGLLPSMALGAAYNTQAGMGSREGSIEERFSPWDPVVGAALPPLLSSAGAAFNFGRSLFRGATGATRNAPHPLEERFGRVLTEGERSGDVGARLNEDALRRGEGAARSQAIIGGHDAQRAPVIRQQLTNIATRGLPPLSQNADEAGVRLADELRNAREALHARQSELYDQAFEAAKAEQIPASDELPAFIAAAEDELGFRIPNAARTEIETLHEKIRRGNATQADVQRTRQRLNRLRTTAVNARDDAAEFDIGETIGALDRWRSGLVRDPGAARLMSEADAVHRDMRSLFSAQGRVGLSTGHTGRVDLGGRAVDRAINIEGESGILDAILGRGGAGSSQSALAAVRRIRQIGTGRIKYTNRGAASGIRLPGRPSIGNGGTRGQSRLDMRLDAARRFAADSPESPVSQQYFGGQAQQPLPVLQSLREGIVHRLSSNWDRYLRAVEDGVQTRIAPTQRLWNDLDTALNGSGASVMRELFTEGELQTLREFQDFIKRMIPPAGANTSNTKIAIFRAVQKGFDRLVGLIPGIGPVIRELGEQAGSVQAARRAIRPPGNAPPPITNNIPQRLQNMGATFSGASPPEWRPSLEEATGVADARRGVGALSEGRLAEGGNDLSYAAMMGLPFIRGPRLAIGTAAALAGTAYGTGVANAQEQEAQERATQTADAQARLTEVESGAREIDARLEILENVDASNPESVKAAQRILGVRVDGRIGPETRPAIEGRIRQLRADRQALMDERRILQADASARRMAPGGASVFLREAAGPAGVLLGVGGAALARKLGVGSVNNLVRGRGALPPMTSHAAYNEAARRMGNVNEFARRGGAGRNVPFTGDTQSRFGFSPRAGAREGSQLYNVPQRVTDPLTLAGVGGGAGESYLAYGLLQDTRGQLARAEANLQAHPESDEARAEVQRLRDLEAVYLGLWRLGQGAALGSAAAALKIRPNVAGYDTEVATLNRLFAPRAPRAPRPPRTGGRGRRTPSGRNE